VNTQGAKAMDLGATNAVIRSIRTNVDTSVTISLDINPNDQELIAKLMNKFLNGHKVVCTAFVDVPKEGNSDDWGL